jgi:hypothetical protein
MARFANQSSNQCKRGNSGRENYRGFTHSSGFYTLIACMQGGYPKDSRELRQ